MSVHYTLIDPAVLLDAAGDDGEGFDELLAVFLRIVPGIASQLAQAVADGSHAIVAQHAHSLKSCLSLLGALACSAQLEALERAALRREAGCGDGFGALREQLDGVLAEARLCQAARARGAAGGQQNTN